MFEIYEKIAVLTAIFFVSLDIFQKIYIINSLTKNFLIMQQNEQKFLVIVKPGFLDVKSEIREIFLDNGFNVVNEKLTKMSEKIAKQFYSHLREKPFYQEVVDYMTSGEIYVIIFSGFIEDARGIIGPTDPESCEDWQIRHIYGRDRMRNAVHCSDSVESAEREMALIDDLNELWFFGGLLPLFCLKRYYLDNLFSIDIVFLFFIFCEAKFYVSIGVKI